MAKKGIDVVAADVAGATMTSAPTAPITRQMQQSKHDHMNGWARLASVTTGVPSLAACASLAFCAAASCSSVWA